MVKVKFYATSYDNASSSVKPYSRAMVGSNF